MNEWINLHQPAAKYIFIKLLRAFIERQRTTSSCRNNEKFYSSISIMLHISFSVRLSIRFNLFFTIFYSLQIIKKSCRLALAYLRNSSFVIKFFCSFNSLLQLFSSNKFYSLCRQCFANEMLKINSHTWNEEKARDVEWIENCM
jgi:hypothetical protein